MSPSDIEKSPRAVMPPDPVLVSTPRLRDSTLMLPKTTPVMAPDAGAWRLRPNHKPVAIYRIPELVNTRPAGAVDLHRCH